MWGNPCGFESASGTISDRLESAETVLTFYAARAAQEGGLGAKGGVVTAVQRTSSDLRLNPHLHMIAFDGAWREQDGVLSWEGLGHLGTLAYAKPLCASLDGFTLHAATRAGALDSGGREALLRYVLRPPVDAGARGAAS